MNNMIRLGTISALIWGVVTASSAIAATEQQKMDAIQNGLAYLASTQQSGGYWSYGGYEQAATGAALTAFLSQVGHWGSNTAAYQAVVDNGINYLLSGATTTTVTVRSDGLNPCSSGTSCTGIYWNGSGEATYTTGLVAVAIGQYAASNPSGVATSTGPLAGMTWTQIAQGITNMFAAGQTTAAGGNRRGGWRYFPISNDSDSSTTQWAVLSMIYDQSLGATTPQFVKDELKYWLAADQASDGSGCYQPGNMCDDSSDTGSLLLGLRFVGQPASDPAVQNALSFLNSSWTTTANGTWYGNFGHPYAMWADYKALELTVGLNDTGTITNLLSNCGAPTNLPGNPPGSTACNWYQDYNDWLVNNQLINGSWSGYAYWYGPMATAFDVSILAATQVPLPPIPTPEPATLNIFLLGLLGFAGMGMRRFI